MVRRRGGDEGAGADELERLRKKGIRGGKLSEGLKRVAAQLVSPLRGSAIFHLAPGLAPRANH